MRSCLRSLENLCVFAWLMGRGAESPGFVLLTAREDRPDGSGELVRDGGHDHAIGPALEQAPNPWAAVRLARNDCARPVHQQRAQVRITAFADAQLPYSTARASLSRHQAERGRKLSTGSEEFGIANRGYRSSCGEHAHARHRSNRPTGFAVAHRVCQTPIDGGDLRIDRVHARPLDRKSTRLNSSH